jgi:serine/threonine protein kinase
VIKRCTRSEGFTRDEGPATAKPSALPEETYNDSITLAVERLSFGHHSDYNPIISAISLHFRPCVVNLRGALLMIGVRLGRNHILEKIGEGGMAAVYRGQDEHLGREVAVKVLPAGTLADEATRKRFRKEAMALSRVSHPNIETIYDFDTQSGVDYLVMEYISGLTLREMLARGPLSEKEISSLGLQMAEGLAAAHDKGIIHCDFKPGNIMVSPEGRLKILDFGLARLTRPGGAQQDLSTDSSTHSRGAGTLPYMAPEQLTGDALDARTDIYALGTVLYEMATGRLPFQEAMSTALVNEIVHKPPPPPGRLRPDISMRLEELILKCLDKDPRNRYQSAKEILVDLRRSSTTDPSQIIAPYARRRKWQPWFIAATLIAGLFLAIVISWSSRGRKSQSSLPGYQPSLIRSTIYWDGQPAISPDGSRIAFTSDEYGNLDICLSDVRGLAQVRLTDHPADDMDPAWFPQGEEIAFTSYRSGKSAIWKTSALTGSTATPLIENARQPAISPDGLKIAFTRVLANGTSHIGIALLDNPARVTILTNADSGGVDASNPVWSPDSRKICFVNRRELWTVDVESGSAHQITFDGEDKSGPAWSESHIYYSSYQGGVQALWRIPWQGGAAESVTRGIGPGAGHPSVSGDRRMLVYAMETIDRQLRILNRESGEEKATGGLAWYMPAIAPDGGRIIWIQFLAGPDRSLWAQKLDHGGPVNSPYRLFQIDGVASHPAFSPDGQWIAYYLIRDNKRDIWVVSAAGLDPMRFTEDGLSKHPAWSRNGSMIAFSSERKGTSQIWMGAVKSGKSAGEVKQITQGEFTAFAPVWSQDGATVAFQGVSKEQTEVWVAPVDRSKPAWPITSGGNIKRIRWDWRTGDLLVSGTWGGSRVVLHRVSPITGEHTPYQPAVDFGGMRSFGFFDITPDGKWLVFSREDVKDGHIGLLKAINGFF